MSTSALSFFRVGLMTAFFMSDGKVPVFNEELMMWSRTGVSSVTQSLRRNVGIGSRQQNLLDILESKYLSSSAVISEKL
jgi:hypothetical protein